MLELPGFKFLVFALPVESQELTLMNWMYQIPTLQQRRPRLVSMIVLVRLAYSGLPVHVKVQRVAKDNP